MENIKFKSNTIAEGQQTAPEFHGGGTERIAYLTFIMWFPQGSYTNVTDPSGCCISKQNPY